MQTALKYGQDLLSLSLPERASVSVLQPSSLPVLNNVEESFNRAMDSPLGGLMLEAMAAPGTVSIVVPDETRPAPVKTLLPLLLKRLYRAFPELRPADITIVVAAVRRAAGSFPTTRSTPQ